MNVPFIEPYFRYYSGEEYNPFDSFEERDKSRFWNLEKQWGVYKDNQSYMEKALDLYYQSGLDDFCGEDRVPVEFKAYLHCRMVKTSHYFYTTDSFRKIYSEASYFNRISFRYYKGERSNPFPKKDIRNKFWYGEMMFVQNRQQQSFERWIKEGKSCIEKLEQNCESEKVALIKKYNMESLGILMYIGTLFDKWTTLNTSDWIFKY